MHHLSEETQGAKGPASPGRVLPDPKEEISQQYVQPRPVHKTTKGSQMPGDDRGQGQHTSLKQGSHRQTRGWGVPSKAGAESSKNGNAGHASLKLSESSLKNSVKLSKTRNGYYIKDGKIKHIIQGKRSGTYTWENPLGRPHQNAGPEVQHPQVWQGERTGPAPPESGGTTQQVTEKGWLHLS